MVTFLVAFLVAFLVCFVVSYAVGCRVISRYPTKAESDAWMQRLRLAHSQAMTVLEKYGYGVEPDETEQEFYSAYCRVLADKDSCRRCVLSEVPLLHEMR